MKVVETVRRRPEVLSYEMCVKMSTRNASLVHRVTMVNASPADLRQVNASAVQFDMNISYNYV